MNVRLSYAPVGKSWIRDRTVRKGPVTTLWLAIVNDMATDASVQY